MQLYKSDVSPSAILHRIQRKALLYATLANTRDLKEGAVLYRMVGETVEMYLCGPKLMQQGDPQHLLLRLKPAPHGTIVECTAGYRGAYAFVSAAWRTIGFAVPVPFLIVLAGNLRHPGIEVLLLFIAMGILEYLIFVVTPRFAYKQRLPLYRFLELEIGLQPFDEKDAPVKQKQTQF